MICVISQINFTTESNRKFIRIGFFVVKNVGILFQNKVTILMAELGRQKYKLSIKFQF